MVEKIFAWILSFPFKQIAQLLRGMSEASDGGNVAAWIIYVMIGLLPLAWLGIKHIRKTIKLEDWLLPVISGLIWYVLYININPALFWGELRSFSLYEPRMATAGGMVYSAITVYIVFKLVRWIRGGNMELIGKCFTIFTVVTSIMLLIGGISEVQKIIDGFATRFYPDTELAVKLAVTLLAIADVVTPAITLIVVLVYVRKAIKEYTVNGMSDELLECVKGLEKKTTLTLVVCMLVNMSYNVLQLVMCKYILATNIMVYLPVMELISLVGIMIVSKLVLESKRVKEENELFV